MTARKCAYVVYKLTKERVALLNAKEDVEQKIAVNEHMFDFTMRQLAKMHAEGKLDTDTKRKK